MLKWWRKLKCKSDKKKTKGINWLTAWYWTPSLAAFQSYRGVKKDRVELTKSGLIQDDECRLHGKCTYIHLLPKWRKQTNAFRTILIGKSWFLKQGKRFTTSTHKWLLIILARYRQLLAHINDFWFSWLGTDSY